MKKFLIFLTIIFSAFFSVRQAKAQSVNGANVISTAVPFLTIAPDSRGAALGETGASTSPDAYSQFWNPAKYAFIDGEMGLSLSYSPWMRSVIDDMNLSYLTYFARISDRQTFSTAVRYFSYGSMTYYNTEGLVQSYLNPYEFSWDVAYATKLTREISASIAFRYIRSDMASGDFESVSVSPANAVATDVAFYYRRVNRNGYLQNTYNIGLVLQNIGTPISYDDGVTQNYLPANFRLGGGFEMALDRYNQLKFSLDFNKLMTPTDNGTDYGVMDAIFRSFSDAPGGFNEELQEFTTSVGAEYLYDEKFALRAGFFNENENKGGRSHLTFGAGVRIYAFTFDMSYLYSLSTVSPLANTMRISVAFDFSEWFN